VTGVTARVPAKLNLQLAVGPRRPDGYHGLVTVFHAVSLFDEVTVEPAAGDADTVSVHGEGADEIPANGDNLALRAVAAIRDAADDYAGHADRALAADRFSAADFAAKADAPVHVTIRKRIPVAGGLAGGSADAAAAIVACNELWGGTFTQQQLCETAAQVGSDVAFAVLGGTAVGRGRGELLTPALVKASTRYHWVLAFADGQLATPEVYATFDRLAQRADGDPPEPELSAGLMTALRAGEPGRVGRALANDLQPAAISLYPALRKTLDAGREFGALGALVSGSGPTCFFLTASESRALDLAVALSGAGVCRSVARATGPAPGAMIVTGAL
jgi:4-diphosphocytidyl-2-C-methyl-D-erythritol kinase